MQKTARSSVIVTLFYALPCFIVRLSLSDEGLLSTVLLAELFRYRLLLSGILALYLKLKALLNTL